MYIGSLPVILLLLASSLLGAPVDERTYKLNAAEPLVNTTGAQELLQTAMDHPQFSTAKISRIRLRNVTPKATQQSVKWIDSRTMLVTEKYWITQYLSPYLQAPRSLERDGVPDGQIVEFPLHIKDGPTLDAGVYFTVDYASGNEASLIAEGDNPITYKFDKLNTF